MFAGSLDKARVLQARKGKRTDGVQDFRRGKKKDFAMNNKISQ